MSVSTSISTGIPAGIPSGLGTMPAAPATSPPEVVAARALDDAAGRRTNLLADLTKARLTAMVLVTTAVGVILASPTAIAWSILAVALVGTALAAACANILNQVLECERDALMRRTRARPIPSGRISTMGAVTIALFSGWAGVMVLGLWTHPLAAGLALLNIVLYVGVYTPLKTRTTLNTLVGAVTGAIPPMIGWVAVTGSIDVGAWVLGAILFVWQLPHFLALAWMYRDDYRAGGFVMLPLRDPRGTITAETTLLTSLMLLPIGLLAFLTGLAGAVFAGASVVLAVAMILLAVRLAMRPSDAAARRVFLASIAYLPLLLLAMVLDRGPILRPMIVDTPAAVEAAAADPFVRPTIGPVAP